MPKKKPRRSNLPRERIVQVATWLKSGVTSTQVAAIAASQWGISDRQARNYLREARERFVDDRAVPARAAAPAIGEHGEDAELAAYAALGEVPLHDGLATVDHLLRALGVGASIVMRLRGISPLDRLEELRRTARSMAPLLSDERRFDAEDAIKKDAASVDDDDGAPELENAPTAGLAPKKALRLSHHPA